MLAMAAKVIPSGLRRRLIGKVTGRAEEDIFPTAYKCNTRRKIKRLLEQSGLTIERVDYLDSGFMFKGIPPLHLLEILYIKMIRLPGLRHFKAQIMVTAVKK